MKKIDLIFIPMLIVGGSQNWSASVISSTEPVTLAFQYPRLKIFLDFMKVEGDLQQQSRFLLANAQIND